MSRWLCFKYRFAYQHSPEENETCKHKECAMKFLVSINQNIADEEMICSAALKAMKSVGALITGDTGTLPNYDFGELSSNDMMDDIKKLFLVNLPEGDKKVKLWLEKDAVFSLYDDAKDINKD